MYCIEYKASTGQSGNNDFTGRNAALRHVRKLLAPLYYLTEVKLYEFRQGYDPEFRRSMSLKFRWTPKSGVSLDEAIADYVLDQMD